MRNLKWIALAVVACLLLIIIFRNLEETDLELVFVTITLPLAALLLVTLAIGFAFGLSASTLWRMRSWRKSSNKPANQDD